MKARYLHASATLTTAVCVVIFSMLSPLLAQENSTVKVSIRVDLDSIVGKISPDFIGFGYETSAVAQTSYFSGQDKTLIQLYRNLSDEGLIRIGGLASDNTQYVPQGVSRACDFRHTSIINQTNLANLAIFTRATGWKVMWGLNLGSGTKAQAVEAAVSVDMALGDRLQSFQVGNEVDNMAEVKGRFENFHSRYVNFKTAVRAALPKASFSGPDSAKNWSFISGFADAESGDMKLLTQHYYCSDAHDPTASIAKMLLPDAGFEARLKDLQALCQKKGIDYRINEVNSYSSGGKPGVSDTFASALWCLDFMFTVASHGGNGVNMQTDFNHLAWISHYSPIVHDEMGVCTARPEYYGMLAFALAGKGDLVKLDVEKGDINLSAYMTKQDAGDSWITVINKDFSRDAEITTKLPAGYATADGFRLQAPKIDSPDRVSLAHAVVTAEGSWTAGAPELIAIKQRSLDAIVPHASAILIHVRP